MSDGQRAVNIDAVYAGIRKQFRAHRMPVVDLIEAQTHDPFKVLVSTILSARTKDQTTAAASARLFQIVKKPHDLRSISVAEIGKRIFPVGFHRNKAQYLHDLPDKLEELFGGRIPDTVDELIQLPGVGRKTANLVVSVGFRKPAICVDVHVHRICNRLGYLRTATPFHTEMRLRQILPVKYWITINSYLVSFGQHTCTPINPHCDACPIYRHCRRIGVKTKHTRKS
jgi:endonuclease III